MATIEFVSDRVQRLPATSPQPEMLVGLMLAALSGGFMGFLLGLGASLVF